MDTAKTLHPLSGTDEDLPEAADVVVVGGGIAGASTLWHLAEAGIDALLLERGRVGGGATAAAIGILSPPVRQPFHEMARHRGDETAARIWRFALDSVASLGAALTEAGAADDAELDLSGGTVLAESHSEHEVRASFEALQRAGFPVRWVEAAEVRADLRGRGFVGGFVIEGLGSIHPGATALALVRDAMTNGASVREGVAVDAVEGTAGGHVCRTEAGDVRARMVVYATHTDSRRFSSLLGDEIVPVRGQALSGRIVGDVPFHGAYSTHWKLNVWRVTRDGRLALSGWRHDAWDRAYWRTRPQVDPHLQDDLEAWFTEAFPGLRLTDVTRWSGIFGWTADYLPMVGSLPGTTSEIVVSGFSGGGLPFAFGCGRIVAAIVAGEEPPAAAELFNPRRFV